MPAAMTRRYLVIALVAATLSLALPATFPDDGGPTGFDRWIGRTVETVFGACGAALSTFAALSTPFVVIPALAATAVFAAIHRRPVAPVLLGPLAAVLANAWIFKPLAGRPLDHYLAYPSGHTVSLVSAITVIALTMRSARAEIAGAAIGTVVLICAGIGMIGFGYHHPTDVIGGVGVGIAVPVLIERLSRIRSAPG